MSAESDVRAFLVKFHQVMKIWPVLYLNRDKNRQALADLEIPPAERTEVLKLIELIDFSQGPLNEDFHGSGEMWVFGRMVKGVEVYIKITMNALGDSPICISFHPSEFVMNYPFRNKQTES